MLVARPDYHGRSPVEAVGLAGRVVRLAGQSQPADDLLAARRPGKGTRRLNLAVLLGTAAGLLAVPAGVLLREPAVALLGLALAMGGSAWSRRRERALRQAVQDRNARVRTRLGYVVQASVDLWRDGNDAPRHAAVLTAADPRTAADFPRMAAVRNRLVAMMRGEQRVDAAYDGIVSRLEAGYVDPTAQPAPVPDPGGGSLELRDVWIDPARLREGHLTEEVLLLVHDPGAPTLHPEVAPASTWDSPEFAGALRGERVPPDPRAPQPVPLDPEPVTVRVAASRGTWVDPVADATLAAAALYLFGGMGDPRLAASLVAGVVLLGVAWRAWRGRVVADADGLEVRRGGGRRRVSWRDLTVVRATATALELRWEDADGPGRVRLGGHPSVAREALARLAVARAPRLARLAYGLGLGPDPGEDPCAPTAERVEAWGGALHVVGPGDVRLHLDEEAPHHDRLRANLERRLLVEQLDLIEP